MKKVKAATTWGDGPDVLVTNIGHPYLLYKEPVDKDKWPHHGTCYEGSFGLTADEAVKLAHELIGAAMSCKAIEDTYQKYREDAERSVEPCSGTDTGNCTV